MLLPDVVHSSSIGESAGPSDADPFFRGRLIQLDLIADASDDELIAECWDVSSGAGEGLLFTILDRSGGLFVRSEMADFPVTLLEEVLTRMRADS